jgi:hypothetical protein
MDHEVIGLPESCNTGDWLCLLHGGYEIFILRPPKDPNTLDAPGGQLAHPEFALVTAVTALPSESVIQNPEFSQSQFETDFLLA